MQKHTPSHLHFRIYTYAGPINPLPFVNKTVRTAPAVSEKNLNGYLRLTKAQKTIGKESIKTSTLLVPIAVTADGYISELPDGKMIKVPFTAVQFISAPVKSDAVAGKGKKGEKI